MPGRPHSERLLHDLKETRDELLFETGRMKAEDIGHAPAEGMKTIKELLREIGAMEAECTTWLSESRLLEWDKAVDWSGDDLGSTLADLERVRVRTLAYLQDATEEKLETPTPLHESWYQYFPVKDIEPEELIRWIVRHKYYHLGQIITYRWILGDNPYKRS